MSERRFEVGAAALIAQHVGDGQAAGLLKPSARRQRAGRVGQLRLGARKPSESCLQPRQRNVAAGFLHRLLRPLEITRLEGRRQTLVQPGRHPACRERADQRVRVLVGEDAVKLLAVVERAAHRDANDPVIRTRRPRRRPRDVVELFRRIQHHRNRIARVDAEELADAPVGGVERLDGLGRQRGFGGPFK